MNNTFKVCVSRDTFVYVHSYVKKSYANGGLFDIEYILKNTN